MYDSVINLKLLFYQYYMVIPIISMCNFQGNSKRFHGRLGIKIGNEEYRTSPVFIANEFNQ